MRVGYNHYAPSSETAGVRRSPCVRIRGSRSLVLTPFGVDTPLGGCRASYPEAARRAAA